MSNLGSGQCISDKLFVSEPLFAILAELEVEAGHEGAKHTTTLSQHTYRGAERYKAFYLFTDIQEIISHRNLL